MERIVIIPALNQEEGLRDLVEANWNRKNQVILVDDGSDEKYEKLFRELSEKCIVLHHKRNQGKGAAIKTALRYIKEELWECSVIGLMDADGQHLPEDMEKILMKAESEPSALILGSGLLIRVSHGNRGLEICSHGGCSGWLPECLYPIHRLG